MANTLFTGKGTGIILPDQDKRSMENMSSMIINAEKLKADVYQRNKAEFEKATDIDPVFLLTDSAQKAQSELLTNFNNKYGKIFQQYGGNIPDAVKQQMSTEKKYLIMNQQKMTADMQQAFAAKDAIQKDVQGNLDHEDFQKRWDDYTSSGKWDASPLLPKAIDPDEYFNKAVNKVNGTPSNVTTTKTVGGIPYKETFQASGTEQEGRERVRSVLMGNDRAAMGYIKKFQELKNTDPEAYKRYLDTDKNGIVSPSEENAVKTTSNPILQWAQDNYWHKALDMKLSQPTKVNTGTASSGNMRTWQGSKYTPMSAMASPYPSLPSKRYHPFINLSKQVTIPISNMELLEPDKATSTVEKPNQSIKGFVTGYDEESGKLTFLISQDYKDLDYPTLAAGKGMQVAAPKSDFSKEMFDDLEIVNDKGGYSKLKELSNTTPTLPTTNSWDKYRRPTK